MENPIECLLEGGGGAFQQRMERTKKNSPLVLTTCMGIMQWTVSPMRVPRIRHAVELLSKLAVYDFFVIVIPASGPK